MSYGIRRWIVSLGDGGTFNVECSYPLDSPQLEDVLGMMDIIRRQLSRGVCQTPPAPALPAAEQSTHSENRRA
jgi:hypothetical protein